MTLSDSKPPLTLKAAQAILAGAQAEAMARGVAVSAAVLDAGGHLLAFARMDAVHLGTIDVAIAKARSAAYFRKPTSAFAQSLADGATGLLAIPNLLPVEGGVPLLRADKVVGALGISGASSQIDHAIALAGAAALEDGND